MLKELLKNNLESTNPPALIIASCLKGVSLEVIKILISCKTMNLNLNRQDKFGNSALHYLCATDNLPTVKFVLENGADQYISNIKGKRPIDVAASTTRFYLRKLSKQPLNTTLVHSNDEE
jgi:ankyrin repeat protein